MRSRQPARSPPARSPADAPPRVWLMTDERQGAALWTALARLPRGAGIVFRHHATPPAPRRALYERVRRVARARGLVLVLAGTIAQAARWRADGAHGASRRPTRALLRTMSVHDHLQASAARRAGAGLAFISPVCATRSHPGSRPLGALRFALLARAAGMPAIALGGMDAIRASRLPRAHGWAGIDAWTYRRKGSRGEKD